MRLVSDNEEAVEPPPTWDVAIEASPGTFAQHYVTGYPSFSGPLLTFFSAEDDSGAPVFLVPYHRVVRVLPHMNVGEQIAN